MTAVEEENTLDAGEWGLFVARAVQDIRRELGEAAANRVATSLHNQKAEAIDAATDQLHTTRAVLEQANADVTEARRAHERLQADVGRMEATVREAKSDAARIRSEAADLFARRRAETDALAEAESRRIADAWDDLHAQEADVATRRSELLDLDEHANRRLAEIEAAQAELADLRDVIDGERLEAQRLVEESIEKLDAVEVKRAEELAAAEEEAAEAAAKAEVVAAEERAAEEREAEQVLDLRDEAIDVRENALDDREAELVEWEAELVARAQEVERQASAVTPMMPPPSGNIAGWGRRNTDDL